MYTLKSITFVWNHEIDPSVLINGRITISRLAEAYKKIGDQETDLEDQRTNVFKRSGSGI